MHQSQVVSMLQALVQDLQGSGPSASLRLAVQAQRLMQLRQLLLNTVRAVPLHAVKNASTMCNAGEDAAFGVAGPANPLLTPCAAAAPCPKPLNCLAGCPLAGPPPFPCKSTA